MVAIVPERTPDSPVTVVAAIWLCSIGTVATYIMPLLTDGAINDLHFSERSAGMLASAILAGAVVSALLSSLWVRRIRWRTAARLAVCGQLTATVLSLIFHTSASFIFLQGLAGFFGGANYSLAMTVLSDGKRPARTFGLLVATQATLSAVELIAGPYLLRTGGMNAVLWTLVILSIAGLPFCALLPVCSRVTSAPSGWRGAVGAPIVFALAACFLFYTCVGSYWTYIGLVGATANLTDQGVANDLAAATVIGVSGALLPTWLGDRHGHRLPMWIGALLIAAAALLIVPPVSALRFMVSATIFNLGWNYWVTYQLATVALVDRSGRGVAVTPAFFAGGGAVGAAVAAQHVTVQSQGSLAWMVLAATGGTLLLFHRALSAGRVGGNE